MAGWVGRGDGAGFWLGSLYVSFLGFWVGWAGRDELFIFPSFWVLGRMDGPRQKAGLLLGSLHIFFLGAWVGWISPGLSLGALYISFFLCLGSDG